MLGIDKWHRPFITILYSWNNEYILETLFQRYTMKKILGLTDQNIINLYSFGSYFIDKE